MKNKSVLKIYKRIISFVLTLALIITSVYWPADIKIPMLTIFIKEPQKVVKADEEVCPYSDVELTAATFDQSTEIAIDTVDKLCKFSWWYKKYASISIPTNVSIGITGSSFGGEIVILIGDNFTSIGTENKPFYGTVKISSVSNNLFFCKKPFFGYVEQASKIVDENNTLRSIGFVRSKGNKNSPVFSGH